jgi:hypothetical protein
LHARLSGLVLVVATIAGLTSCAPSAGTAPNATSVVRPTQREVATPSAEPAQSSPEDIADPATWVVTGAGIGPLRLAGRFDPAAPDAGPYHATESGCPNPSVTQLEGDGLADMTVVTTDDGAEIALVQVTDWADSGAESAASTATGIRLGSTVAELETAYPGIEQSGVSNNSGVYAVEDSGGWIVFWVEDAAVVLMSASPTSSVPSELCG